MLTKHDLSQIQKIVQDETRKIVQSETRKIVQDETRRIVREETPVALERQLKPIKKDIATLKEDVSEIRKDMKSIVRFFDREYLELRRQIECIEDHLNLSPAS